MSKNTKIRIVSIILLIACLLMLGNDRLGLGCVLIAPFLGPLALCKNEDPNDAEN